MAQKKVKKAFEAGGCHIGTKDKHASWKAGNGDFQTVDAFLESDNSAGTVRDQLALYTLFLMFDTRPNCAFLHLSREEFLQQMEEGVNLHDPVASAKQLAAARAPGAAVAVPPVPAAPDVRESPRRSPLAGP